LVSHKLESLFLFFTQAALGFLLQEQLSFSLGFFLFFSAPSLRFH
jgi:hypothetical protein